MILHTDAGESIPITEPRARRMVAYLARRQAKLAEMGAGSVRLHFSDAAHKRLAVEWTERDGEE